MSRHIPRILKSIHNETMATHTHTIKQDILKPESGNTNELYVNLNNGSGAVLPENQATSNDTPSAPADSDKYASNIMYEITFKSDRKEEITGLIYRNIKYYFD